LSIYTQKQPANQSTVGNRQFDIEAKETASPLKWKMAQREKVKAE